MDKVLFSSESVEWETPSILFNKLNSVFNFNLDVCATKYNTKCSNYYSIEDNGLEKEWSGNCWCNPPYGRSLTGKWIEKAIMEVLNRNANVVLLVPARTDTIWFHDYIYKKQYTEILFLRGRLKFGNSKNSAPFPSMIIVVSKNRDFLNLLREVKI